MTENTANAGLAQFKTTYFEECAELLDTAEEIFLRLLEHGGEQEDFNAVFRCVHSIKGGAGAFGFDGLVRFAHVFETALDALRAGRLEFAPPVAKVMVGGIDILGDFVRAAREDVALPPGHGEKLLDAMAALNGSPPPSDSAASPVPTAKPEAAEQTFLVKFQPAPGMLRTGNDPVMMMRELNSLGLLTVEADLSRLPPLSRLEPQDAYLGWTATITTDKGRDAILEVFEFVAGDCAEVTVEAAPGPSASRDLAPPQAETAPPAVRPSGAAPQSASIRVELDKVDRLVNMVGEMVITQAMLNQLSSRIALDGHRDLMSGLQELSQHTRELQESVMAIRAQPVKVLFSRAPRIVRDLSGKLGKQVRLVMNGEGTEVDKTVIEQLSDPMVHLIRNSLDHGLETPDARRAKGKPPEGTITLSAEHRSGRIVITVQDDGGGIDRSRVLAKAVEKGLVEQGQPLTDEQIDQLIFAPGFSTAAVLSDISGRGVGLDVVKKNIQDVGGRVSVQSSPGAGTTFTLSLPLTLAVMDGMLVAVGSERYVLPLTNIVESLRPTPDQVRHLVDVGTVMTLRGDYIRLVALHHLFGVAGAVADPTRGLVVVVEAEGGDRIGLLVDELVGQQQVVIKSLESNFRPVRSVSAATILGDGRVALILDVGALREDAVPEQARLAPTPGAFLAAE